MAHCKILNMTCTGTHVLYIIKSLYNPTTMVLNAIFIYLFIQVFIYIHIH